MRFCFAVFYLFLMANRVQSQSIRDYGRDSAQITRIKHLQIQLDTSERASIVNQLPFNSIQVVDVRFDTTQIGIYAKFSNLVVPVIQNYKINVGGGISKGFNNYLNSFYKNNLEKGDRQLVCFIKKIRTIRRDTLVENSSLNRNTGQIGFNTEVFLKDGNNYYPVFKIDTTFIQVIGTGKKEVAEEIKDFMVMPALKILQAKINSTSWEKIRQKKYFDEASVIDSYTKNRFNLPILAQGYKKGVFKTFADFKNNSPSITDFQVKKEKFNSVSLIDRNGDYINTIKTFAFSDGTRCWIQSGNYCYPLVRVGNNFEFFYSIAQTLKILAALDMDKGDVL